MNKLTSFIEYHIDSTELKDQLLLLAADVKKQLTDKTEHLEVEMMTVFDRDIEIASLKEKIEAGEQVSKQRLSIINDKQNEIIELKEQLAQSREETKVAQLDADDAQQSIEDNEILTEQQMQKAFCSGVGIVSKPANDLLKLWLAYKNQEGL